MAPDISVWNGSMGHRFSYSFMLPIRQITSHHEVYDLTWCADIRDFQAGIRTVPEYRRRPCSMIEGCSLHTTEEVLLVSHTAIGLKIQSAICLQQSALIMPGWRSALPFIRSHAITVVDGKAAGGNRGIKAYLGAVLYKEILVDLAGLIDHDAAVIPMICLVAARAV
ncbi:Uncharacterised protein [uncultured archaeon]|nr:Uncharacterised protein [uncultured archaeon]